MLKRKAKKITIIAINFNTTVSIIKRKKRQKIIKMLKHEKYC